MKLSLSLFALTLAAGIAFSSCSGNSSQSGAEEVIEEVKPKELTPEELGGKIGELYVQAIVEVTNLVKDQPDATEVYPKIAELKEKYVKELVELGKKREAMDDEGKSKVDLTIRIALQNVYHEPVYSEYSEAVTAYFKNREVHKLLTDFNIIGQYASFELLKKQEPEEAQRLGIE